MKMAQFQRPFVFLISIILTMLFKEIESSPIKVLADNWRERGEESVTPRDLRRDF